MKIRLTTRHVDLESELREYVEEKIEHLVRYFDRVDEAHVVFAREGHLYTADLTVHAARVVVSSEQAADDPRSAFDRALVKVERQIRRHKGRVRDHKHGEAMAEAAEVIGGTAPGEIGIIPETLTSAILSPEEALRELDEQNARFLMFVNAETTKVNVIYRRDDGNYGLVEPEE